MAETKRQRKITLTDDPKQNVKTFACARLNKAVRSIEVFGNCFGSNYDWNDKQIDKAEQVLQNAVKATVQNLRLGTKTVQGITL